MCLQDVQLVTGNEHISESVRAISESSSFLLPRVVRYPFQVLSEQVLSKYCI